MSFNKIIIVGYLGRDPELKYTPNGNAVCKMSIATTEKRNNADPQTTWFRVTAWGRQAELCNEYLAKGRQVYVEGRLTLQTFTDREGQTRSSLEVNATDIKFLADKGAGGEEREFAPTRKVDKQEVAQAVKQLDDDDIPF